MLIILIVRQKKIHRFNVVELYFTWKIEKRQIQEDWLHLPLEIVIRAVWNASWLSSLGNAIKIKLSLEGQDHLSLQSQSASYWKPFRTLQYRTMMYLCIDACSTRPAIPDHDAKKILLHDSLCKSVDVFCRSRSSGAHQDAWTRHIHLDAGRMDIEDKFLPWLENLPIVMLLQHNSSHNQETEKGW